MRKNVREEREIIIINVNGSIKKAYLSQEFFFDLVEKYNTLYVEGREFKIQMKIIMDRDRIKVGVS
jgi:hypothetical protein